MCMCVGEERRERLETRRAEMAYLCIVCVLGGRLIYGGGSMCVCVCVGGERLETKDR
jgi:hypothetical protein